jgi:hypothetical protein
MSQFGGKNSKRHFTVVMGNKEHGLYVSSTPSSAARKAVTKLCAANKSKKVEFHIREITQGSKKKTYGPYEGYIEKLKEPIELKGRVIKYKPVAKLSGKTRKKTAAKKGGMRGGAKSIFTDISYKPKFRIVTNADFRRVYLFNIQNLLFNRQKIDTQKNLLDYTVRLPMASSDRKHISFKFSKDIDDEKIEAFLNDQEKKLEILRRLEELQIPYEVKIFLDIPYIFDGESDPRYEEYLYLEYKPSANLASRAPPYNPANNKNYTTLNRMRNINRIRTLAEFNDYTKDLSPENKEKLKRHYEEFINNPLKTNL